MDHFICPVCGENLIQYEHAYACKNRHSFDRAKSGYVNLLQSQKSSEKRHGDDKLMVRARIGFLEKGYYQPLLNGILTECEKQKAKMLHILDVGCGEGWYTDRIFRHLRQQGTIVRMEGIDISKDALQYAARRNPYIAFAVAGINRLPIQSESADILLNLFAPHDAVEYARVLKKDGIWLHAIPLEKHLWGLKSAIYEHPYENKVVYPIFDEFVLQDTIVIKETLSLTEAKDIRNLFRMTPYYYKTGAADQAKLDALQTLTTPIEFAILKYRKK